jgi:hypothetical protein
MDGGAGRLDEPPRMKTWVAMSEELESTGTDVCGEQSGSQTQKPSAL